jgi:hypothetical protein
MLFDPARLASATLSLATTEVNLAQAAYRVVTRLKLAAVHAGSEIVVWSLGQPQCGTEARQGISQLMRHDG